MFKKIVPVSVVIPAYSCNLTIERAIKSIWAQTVLPYEVLVVDDNGGGVESINLFEVIKPYLNLLNIIFVSHLKNLGAPSARNTGLQLSNSEYVALLDADDSWMPTKLEIQFEYMKANPDVFIAGHDISFKDPGGICADIDYKVGRITLLSILMRNTLPTPTLIIRSGLSIRFDEEMKCVDDHLFLMQSIFDGIKVVKINAPLCLVHKPMYGSSGLSGNLFRMQRYEMIAYYKLLKSSKSKMMYGIYIPLVIYSLLKFGKRLLVVYARTVIFKIKFFLN